MYNYYSKILLCIKNIYETLHGLLSVDFAKSLPENLDLI